MVINRPGYQVSEITMKCEEKNKEKEISDALRLNRARQGVHQFALLIRAVRDYE